jgi:hypothetical protein
VDDGLALALAAGDFVVIWMDVAFAHGRFLQQP